MAGITQAQAESHLSTWLTAEEKLAAAKTVEVNGRRLTREDLGEVRRQIDFWDRRVKRLSRGSSISAHRVIVNG